MLELITVAETASGVDWSQVAVLVAAISTVIAALGAFVGWVTSRTGKYIREEVMKITSVVEGKLDGLDKRTRTMAISGIIIVMGFGVYVVDSFMRLFRHEEEEMKLLPRKKK